MSVQALAALETAVSSLFPADVPDGLTRRIRVAAQQLRPLGIGAYVGRHREPGASLYGRRVEARVDVDVDGGADNTAHAYASALAGRMLAQTRSDFATHGLQRIRSLPGTDRRTLAFNVDFEYVFVPQDGEGVIETLALDTYANTTPYRTRLRAVFDAATLAAQPLPLDALLADFAPVDDPQAAPAGAWSLDGATPSAIVQTAATAAGPTALDDPQKAGAQLLWRPRGAPFDLTRFVASFVVHSASPDGIGLVFARRAADDYFFFLASQRHAYHLFGRRRPGGWQTLAAAPAGFSLDADQQFVIGSHDTTLFAQLGEQRTLTASLDEMPGPGEIGLLTHANDAARFLAGRLMELV
ncbi:MAG: hypothetical protein ABIO45_01775 [Burkholderiaceae bacterium]